MLKIRCWFLASYPATEPMHEVFRIQWQTVWSWFHWVSCAWAGRRIFQNARSRGGRVFSGFSQTTLVILFILGLVTCKPSRTAGSNATDPIPFMLSSQRILGSHFSDHKYPKIWCLYIDNLYNSESSLGPLEVLGYSYDKYELLHLNIQRSAWGRLESLPHPLIPQLG